MSDVAMVGVRQLRDLEREKSRMRSTRRGGVPSRRDPMSLSEEGPRFKNAGASTIGAYGLARVSGRVYFDDMPVRTVVTPDTTFGFHWIVNGVNPVEPGEFGVAQRGPDVLFAYDTAPSAGDAMGPKPGQGAASVASPLALLSVLDVFDTTAKYACGILRQINAVTGKCGSNVAALSGSTPGSGTMILWYRSSGGSWSASTMEATVDNFSTVAAASATFLHAVESGGRLVLVFESCGNS